MRTELTPGWKLRKGRLQWAACVERTSWADIYSLKLNGWINWSSVINGIELKMNFSGWDTVFYAWEWPLPHWQYGHALTLRNKKVGVRHQYRGERPKDSRPTDNMNRSWFLDPVILMSSLLLWTSSLANRAFVTIAMEIQLQPIPWTSLYSKVLGRSWW